MRFETGGRLTSAMAGLMAGAVLATRAAATPLDVEVRTQAGAPVPDAVVVAVPVTGLRNLPAPKDAVVDQVDKEFVPYVRAIQVGTLVHFPNKDNIRHHVYSFSPAKTFELPLYSGTPSQPVLFDHPGVVALGCNIHDWMLGYVYVSESPYFAQTLDAGKARIADLPPGDYVVRVWHPDLVGTESANARHVVIESTLGPAQIWSLVLQASVHPKRPGPDANRGYR